MSDFWKTETGKIMAHGVHEHSNGLSLLGSYIALIQLQLKKKNLTDEELQKYTESMESALKRCEEAMDYVYTNIKGLEEQRQK